MLTFLGLRLSSAAFLPPKPYRRLKSFSTPAVAETLAMAKTLKEADVGISCHVSSLPGFRGVLKQRYADFIVNEVDFDGKIVRLSSFDLPAEFPEAKEEEDPHPNDKSYTNEIELFQSLCGEADAELLRGILERINSNKEEEIPPIILSPDSDKPHRAEVHNFFKKKFKFLVTDTVEGPEGNLKCIRVRYCPGGESSRRGKKRKDMFNSSSRNEMPFDSRGSDNWPDHLGKFLRFHLYKENKDTQEALGVIGKMLGLQQRSFGFAGTKDKRAISTQRVTIFKQYAKRLAALNSRLFGIKVGDFCYVRDGLLLGQLSGNRFTITLRDVVADSEESIKAAADGLGRNGFINYYGLQRFGSGSVPTHLIGASLLRGEWKNAVDLILDPREGERTAIRETREAYKESGDIDLALRQLPRYLVAERSVLKCLKKCPGNYLQALRAIPRTLRMMYVHSYQSYLWNHAASIRVQKYGISQVVLGDLVFCKEGSSGKAAAIDNSEPEDDSIDEDNSSNLSDISDAVLLPEEKVQFVKTVNPEDLIAERYTFDDVVLPLPGSRIIYPTNGVADEYHAIAKKDAINLTESVHGAKEFSITRLTGGYRRVFQRPIDFEWELLTYTDSNIPLAETDLDIMSRTVSADTIKEVGLANGEPGDQAENFETEKLSLVADCVIEDGNERRSLEVVSACNLDDDQSTKTSHDHSPKMALKLAFTLPASCYATMAIRELLKTSTSVAYHKTISQ